MSSLLRRAAMASTIALGILGSPVAVEADFSSNACLSGEVDAYDYSELEQNLSESFLDNRARLDLVSESQELTLSVTDLDGNSVCENVADLSTSCQWSLSDDEVFVVKIDNTMRATSSAYELCAR
jgi:hypothetical protein